MKKIRLLSIFAISCLRLCPGTVQSFDADSDVKAVLDTQIEAWNRGDLATFVTTYSDDCIFVGKDVTEGNSKLLAHYREKFPDQAAMGHLTFTELRVHLLDKDVALVTGRFHLDRLAPAGGPAGGIFSLVLHRNNGLWKIALDHTA